MKIKNSRRNNKELMNNDLPPLTRKKKKTVHRTRNDKSLFCVLNKIN